jgi:drug/metabolite transporter (DMT)-like permease
MRSIALVVLLALLWGGSYPLLKVAVETIPPLTVVAVRALLGGAILLAALGPRARLLGEVGAGASLRALLVQSAFTCVIPWILIAWAIGSLDAGLAAILNSLSPIFIFLLTALVTRHEPVTRRKFAGVALGLAGVIAIVGVDALSGLGTRTVAEIACVAGAFSYAVGGVIGVRFARVTPLVPAAGSTLIAAAVLLPLALAVDRPWTLTPSAASIGAVVAAAVFSTGLAMVVYFRLLATVGSIAMSSQAYLRILVGVGLGMAFLGETPSTQALVGLALVVGGVIAMTWPARAAEANGSRAETRKA